MTLPTYDIQDWLFNYAHGKIEIDLAESGITPLEFQDLYDDERINLNYTRDRGSDELRDSIADKYDVNSEDVVVTNGGQEALYLFYQTLPSDTEIITFRPGWQQSWAVPEEAGVNTTVLTRNPSENFALPVKDLRTKVSGQAAAIIINSPQNPTGQRIDKQAIEALRDVASTYEAYVVIDEEYVTSYDESLLHQLPNAFSVASLSKIHGLPGLRTGWIVSDDHEKLDEVVNTKRYTTVSNTAVSERLAAKALDQHDWFTQRYQSMTTQGEEVLADWVADQPRLEWTEPQGTPYAYCSFTDGTDSKAFCKDLIDEHGVLLMPAEVFGDTQAFRITFARPDQELREGLKRVSRAL